jgi:hypothetical protein
MLPLKLSGWKSLRRGALECYQCPSCGTLHEVLFGSDNGFKCFNCKTTCLLEEFKQSEMEATFAVCAECDQEMALTPYREGFIGYLCRCGNCVAVPFENELVLPSDILRLEWNTALAARGVPLTKTCLVAVCETAKDREILKMLQVLAQEENGEFRLANSENDALLAFDARIGIYLGYVLWYNDIEYATLNQLFVVPEQRRRGHAASMVMYWVENHAKRIAEKFVLESPNEAAIALHLKLGHVRKEGDQIVGVNCRFVSGL